MKSHRERELKFDVDDRFAVPDWAGLAGRARLERRTVHLVSTYYDTADRRLLACGLSLRRRDGDVDAGWQLKVPTGSARTEISVPPQTGDELPGRLHTLLAGVLGGQAVRPVAVIRTEREQHRLLQDETLLVEIADDRVHGTALGDRATITSWREVEAELGPAGDERLLTQLAAQLRAAGATPAVAASKLARTLGVSPAPGPGDPSSVVRAYTQRQRAAIVAGDVALRRGLDNVHKTRVAVRRLRSTLRVLAPILDGAPSAELDTELSWYQNLLGAVRDMQVQRVRLAARLAALPPEDVLGPVAGYIDQSLLAEQARHREHLRQALDSDRYLDLLEHVRQWTADPPVTAALDGPELRRLARKAARSARKRLAVALDTDDPALVHRARKAAKRARYASELAATGKTDRRRIKRYKRIQNVLGEHQDSIVATRILRRLATGPQSTAKPNGFTLGVLYTLEQTATDEARTQAARLEH